ncbi:MAG: hypothetical protein HFI10_10565 [Lachnospiraceae bacterium]|nr:hypothetical protein [Lachnospiraceae bacterium]
MADRKKRRIITAVLLIICCILAREAMGEVGEEGEAQEEGQRKELPAEEICGFGEYPGEEHGFGDGSEYSEETGESGGDKEAGEADWFTLEEELRPCILEIICGGYAGSGVVWEITEDKVVVASSGHLLKNAEVCDVICYAGVYYEAEVERVLEDCDVGFAVFPAEQLSADGIELRAVVPSRREKEELIQGEELAVYGSMDDTAGNFVKGYLVEAEREMQLEGYENPQAILLGGILGGDMRIGGSGKNGSTEAENAGGGMNGSTEAENAGGGKNGSTEAENAGGGMNGSTEAENAGGGMNGSTEAENAGGGMNGGTEAENAGGREDDGTKSENAGGREDNGTEPESEGNTDGVGGVVADAETQEYNRGAVDAGMSGSGVFDGQGHLIGILAGGDGRWGFAAVPVWRIWR